MKNIKDKINRNRYKRYSFLMLILVVGISYLLPVLATSSQQELTLGSSTEEYEEQISLEPPSQSEDFRPEVRMHKRGTIEASAVGNAAGIFENSKIELRAYSNGQDMHISLPQKLLYIQSDNQALENSGDLFYDSANHVLRLHQGSITSNGDLSGEKIYLTVTTPGSYMIYSQGIGTGGTILSQIGIYVHPAGATIPPPIVVSLHKNYGDNGSVVQENVEYGGTFNFQPFPQSQMRPHYTFEGWSTQSGENNVDDFFTENIFLIQNKQFFAIWEPVDYTTEFYRNDGSVESVPYNSVDATYITSIGAGNMPVEPTRAGFSFMNWNTNPDGSGTELDENTPILGNSQVYAIWLDLNPSPISHKFTFDGNGGDTHFNYEGYRTEGSSIGSLPEVPSKKGWTSLGWATESNALTPNVTASTIISEDVTFYAVRTRNEYTITTYIYKYSNSEKFGSLTAVTSRTQKALYEEKFSETAPTVPGYSFNSSISTPLTIDSVTQDTDLHLYFVSDSAPPTNGGNTNPTPTPTPTPENVDIGILSLRSKVELPVKAGAYSKATKRDWDNFVSLLDISVRYQGKTTANRPRVRSVNSPDFEDLDLHTTAQNYNQTVTVEIEWTTGKLEEKIVEVKLVDSTPPVIEFKDGYIFEYTLETVPKNESAFIKAIQKGIKGIDQTTSLNIEYLNGSYNSIPKNKLGEHVVYVHGVDESGNLSEKQKAIILKIK